MKNVFWLMALTLPFLNQSCNNESACCGGKNAAKATPTSSTSCSTCEKTTCDQHCAANPNAVATSKALPSCSLDAHAQTTRVNEIIKPVFNQASKIQEIDKGWDLVFPRSKKMLAQLQEIAAFERKCCASFTWEVVDDLKQKQVHLKISGSEAIKEELRSGFEKFGLADLVTR